MQIERGIPVPVKGQGYASAVTAQMNKGDSVLCRSKKELYAVRGAFYRLYGAGSYVSRTVEKDSTWRVWRAK